MVVGGHPWQKSLQDPILNGNKLDVVACNCHDSGKLKKEDHGPVWAGQI
jgi:hypothetical protein